MSKPDPPNYENNVLKTLTPPLNSESSISGNYFFFGLFDL